MATVHTPPIDLYAESAEGFGEEHRDAQQSVDPPRSRPSSNGDRDERATDQSRHGLERVLGW